MNIQKDIVEEAVFVKGPVSFQWRDFKLKAQCIIFDLYYDFCFGNRKYTAHKYISKSIKSQDNESDLVFRPFKQFFFLAAIILSHNPVWFRAHFII